MKVTPAIEYSHILNADMDELSLQYRKYHAHNTLNSGIIYIAFWPWQYFLTVISYLIYKHFEDTIFLPIAFLLSNSPFPEPIWIWTASNWLSAASLEPIGKYLCFSENFATW